MLYAKREGISGMRKEIDLGLATRLMNHGPVILVSSKCGEKINVTTVAWHMPVSKKPPVLALEIGENHFIFECIKETGDFAVNIPSKELVGEVVKCGSCSGRDNDKIALCGFTAMPSKRIMSPFIDESLAVLECVQVGDRHLLEEYNIVLGEVKRAEAEEGAFDEHWIFEKEKNRTIGHLGDRTFCSPGGEILDLREKL